MSNNIIDNYDLECKAYGWMNRHFPSCKKIDIECAEGKYEMPDYVVTWIKNSWKKIDDLNGGTYVLMSLPKPRLVRGCATDPLPDQWLEDVNTTEPINWSINPNNMDKYNKEAFKVLTTEGPDNAFKFMSVDPETGTELSYSEMRARYG
tara:strand:+ start:5121 stop:5567 length:447 start_codon:yes stop_codon:yes gene_type:complete